MRTGKLTSCAGVFIGDPCYILSDDIYDKFIDAPGGPLDNVAGGTCKVNLNGIDYEIAFQSTAFGDGLFPSSMDGAEFGVDSGLIAIVPAELSDNARANDYDVLYFEDTGDFKLDYNDGTIVIVFPNGDWEEIYTKEDNPTSID